MQLSYNSDRSLWEAATVWGEGDVLKAAGLKWDKIYARWQTSDVTKAAKLRAYADAANQAKLDAALEKAAAAAAEEAERQRASVEASRAQTSNLVVPCGEGRTFLDYQRAGIEYALSRRNVLLGDDMGLGKTAQAVGIINSDETLRRILIICPASLARNWIREIGFFGSRALTAGIASQKKGIPDTDIVVTTYDVFSRKAGISKKLKDPMWDLLVLDEAHYCKNGKSARTMEILVGKDTLPISARRKIFLTGTPIPNKPVELWPLVSALVPGIFPDFFDYARRYCGAYKDRFGWNMDGATHLNELQDKLRGSCMVRRLKADVLTELPAKRRQILELTAETPEAKAALKVEAAIEKAVEADVAAAKAEVARHKAGGASADPAAYKKALASLAVARSVAFTEISKVRHQTALAKAPMVADHVRDVLEAADGKIIVFAHHKDVIAILKDSLAEFGVVGISGNTPVASRQAAVDAFQNDPSIRVFVGNLIAAGVGITLTASAHVVFAELDWVPGTLSQAEDRAHRLGQKDSVLVQHLVLEGSMDARMALTVTSKQEAIDAALNDVETSEDREARLAAVAAEQEAATDQALEAAELRLLEAETARAAAEARKAEREATRDARQAKAQAWLADRALARAARLSDSIARAAAALADTDAPGEDERTEILAALRFLAADDQDGATIRNGVGFSKTDSYHGHFLASREALGDTEARVGRELVRRYRGQLESRTTVLESAENPVAVAPVDEVAASSEFSDHQKRIMLGCLKILARRDGSPSEIFGRTDLTDDEARAGRDTLIMRRSEFPGVPALFATAIGTPPPPISVPSSTETPPPVTPIVQRATPVSVAKRGPGRPTKASQGAAVLTQSERNRRWRAARRLKAVSVPGDVAGRLHAMRDTQGVSTEALMVAALDALDRQRGSDARG